MPDTSFITPSPHDLPPRVRVLTTTRFPAVRPELVEGQAAFPGGLQQIQEIWPPTAHAKGAAIEAAFVQRGQPLQHFLPSPPLWLEQVHGIDVAKMNRSPDVVAIRQAPPVADAAVTDAPNVVLALLTADCLPVVIADENSAALAVVHAGWRSLAGGVLENTVRHLACPAALLMAWLGPAIGPAAFEVGEDVHVAFDAPHDAEAAACFVPTGVAGKWHADLYALARLRLRRLGVPKISGGTWCTYSDARRFFSWRRGRDEGRMATFAFLAEP
ncbi:MAG: peptidoglycan editing factor PgeF [Betaproteobacteria bacterium]|nr:peptidoglycan editing factor PgeF [Betaproteobacteria bacterium]